MNQLMVELSAQMEQYQKQQQQKMKQYQEEQQQKIFGHRSVRAEQPIPKDGIFYYEKAPDVFEAMFRFDEANAKAAAAAGTGSSEEIKPAKVPDVELYRQILLAINSESNNVKACEEDQSAVAVPTMQIFVKDLYGKTTSLKVEAENTVADVKEMIEAKTRIPTGQQRLIFNGKQLEVDRTLACLQRSGWFHFYANSLSSWRMN
uniref:Ubiquitin-like domain-containing protein n=1 Tax=Globodera rostochiensis TaxID=31243 RepID=A0A914IGP4_GLORO